MSLAALSVLSFAALTVGQAVTGTFPATPLVSKTFPHPTALPYQVDTDTGLLRGSQFGYNICNSTTQNQDSKCQTLYLNSADDWCLWAPPEPNSEIFDKEGEMVAWCTKPDHGTRVIPNGAITGFQFMKTPDYVQVVGHLNQGFMNMIPGNFGGEMDGGGADLRGNPLGGVTFSNAFSGGNKDDLRHSPHWHNFMGADAFCLKLCDQSKPNAEHFCEHIYDRIGCEYNAPNEVKVGEFLECDGDNQDFPGTYTVNGQTLTYKQPPESLGPIGAMPYTARIPSSSNCKTHTSSVLFAAGLTVSATGPHATLSGSNAPTATPSGSQSSSTGSNPSTPTSSGAAPTGSGNSAESIVVGGVASLLGVIFAAVFLS